MFTAFKFPFQVVLFGNSDLGSTQTTLASAMTHEGCLSKFMQFIVSQPLHHFGITNESTIKMWNVDDGFMYDLPMIC